jgi:catechol 2,3-dioxygenase-like lactoylglutathione lyase family enzyme
MSGADVHRVVAFGRVADVARTQKFYARLGFKVGSELKDENGSATWTYLSAGAGALMFSLADEPVVPDQQRVFFYLYCDDVAGLRGRLIQAGVPVSKICYPPYMQEGEICLTDPDGYMLLIGQAA